MHREDSPHQIIEGVEFENGARLHRFTNAAGVPYSAIYEGDFEAFSNVREKERQMIEHYRDFIRAIGDS